MVIDLATINMAPGQGGGKPEMSFSVSPSTSDVVVAPDEGYVFSGGVVEAVTAAIDANIKPENIIESVSILGVSGTAVVPSGSGVAEFYVAPGTTGDTYEYNVKNLEYFSVTLSGPRTSNLNIVPSTVSQSISADIGYCYVSGTVEAVTSAIDANIHPANIRSGVSILGVTGTYGEGGGIIPSGTLSITSNGVYNVEVYASVDVSMASSPYKYLTGDITGLSSLGWDAESIGYANDNIDFYSTDASCYAVNQDDIDVAQNLDENNITGNKKVRYAPMFTPDKLDWGQEFQGCTNLITIPKYNTSGVQYFGPSSHSGYNGCFAGCSNLKTIPAIDTSAATDMYCMFVNCSSLETVPLLDTSNVVNFAGMFRGCKSLKSVPKFDFSSTHTLMNMFYKCTSLKTVPQFDLSNVTDIQNLFIGCESLEYVPALDTSNVTRMNQVFSWVIESTKNQDVTSAPQVQASAANYGLIHKLDNLKRVDGWDFSGLAVAPNNFFGAYSANAAVITPKSLPNLTHFIVNGKIDFDWNTTGQGFWMLPNLDFDSIKSILQAMLRADTGHSMLFRTTITDDALGTLQSLYDDCVNFGWTITGLTINAAE